MTLAGGIRNIHHTSPGTLSHPHPHPHHITSHITSPPSHITHLITTSPPSHYTHQQMYIHVCQCLSRCLYTYITHNHKIHHMGMSVSTSCHFHHSIILSFLHSVIPSFHSSFCHSFIPVILSFRHSIRHSVIPPFLYSIIPNLSMVTHRINTSPAILES